MAFMPGSSQTTALFRPRSAPRDLVVRAWPLGQGDPCALLAIFGSAVVFAVIALATRSAGTAAVFGGLSLLASWRLLIPVTYELTAGGIQRTCLGRSRRIPWSLVQRVISKKNGLVVFRDGGGSRLGLLWGAYIPHNGNKSDVEAIFDFYLSGRVN